MCKNKFKKGETVGIFPEFQDEGDGDYTWIVLDDEEKGRVSISAQNSQLLIKPIHVVKAEWIYHHDPNVEV